MDAEAMERMREAVRDCSASLPLPILHADKSPCWTALRLAAANDAEVRELVFGPLVRAISNERLRMGTITIDDTRKEFGNMEFARGRYETLAFVLTEIIKSGSVTLTATREE